MDVASSSVLGATNPPHSPPTSRLNSGVVEAQLAGRSKHPMRLSLSVRLLCLQLLLAVAMIVLCPTTHVAAKPTTQPHHKKTQVQPKGTCKTGCASGEFCFNKKRCLPVFKACAYEEDCPSGSTCVDVGNRRHVCLPQCDPSQKRGDQREGRSECWAGFGRCFQIADDNPKDGACYPPASNTQKLGQPCGQEGAFNKAAYHFCAKDAICYGQKGKQVCQIKCDPSKSANPNKVSPNPACEDGQGNCVPLEDGDGYCIKVRRVKTATKTKKPEEEKAKSEGFLAAITNNIWGEFKAHFLDSESGIFWLYIFAHLVFGSLYFLLYLSPGGRLSISAAFAYVFPAKIYKTRQFFNDAVITVLNQIYPIALFLSFEVYSETVGVFVKRTMFATLGTPGFAITGTWAAIGFTFVMLLMSDLGAFVAHWCQHRIPFLWEFHKVHHSATTLSPLTNNRSHPIDLMLISNVTGVLIGIAVGIAGYLSKSTLDDTTIVWINATIVAAPLILENFQHSHIPISFGRLDHLIMSPVMHQIHHSKAPEHLDKNLAQIFSFWDKFAGTMALPKKGETLEFGIDDDKNDDYEKLWVIYFIPFVRGYQVLAAGLSKLLSKL